MSDQRRDAVSRRAYELWEKEGGGHGKHEEHWHQANREIGEQGREQETEQATGPSTAAPDGTTMGEAGEAGASAPAVTRKRTTKKAAEQPTSQDATIANAGEAGTSAGSGRKRASAKDAGSAALTKPRKTKTK